MKKRPLSASSSPRPRVSASPRLSSAALERENSELRERLAEAEARLGEAEETLRAIRSGEVDALVVAGPEGDRVFTLQGAETTYRFLVEEMNEGALLLGPEGRVLYANARFAQLTGVPLEQVTGSSWERFFVPAEQARLQQLLPAAKNGCVRGEFHLQLGSNAPRPVELSVCPLQRERVAGFSVILSDLTERQRAEAALKEANEGLEQRVAERTAELQRSEALLRAITDNSPDPIFLKDRNSRMLLANPATLAALGRSAAEVLGKTDAEFYRDSEAGRRMMANDRRVMETGQPEAVEEVVPGRAGPRTFLSTKTPYRDAKGRVVGVVGVAHDITERKRAEEAVRESERQFRALAESIPNLAWWANGDGYITWYNRRWYEYTGTTPEQMEGWGWQSVHDPEMLPKVLERWKGSIATGEPFDMEFPLRGADGRFRIFLTRVQPLKDAQGRVLRWFGANTDVDELKRSQEAVRASEARYRSLFEHMLEGFAYCQMLYDQQGQAEDFIYLAVNDAFGKVTGLTNVIGKRVTEVIPRIKELTPEVLDIYGRVARTGQAERFEINFTPLARHLSIAAYSPAPGHFVAIFDDITQRKHAEQAIQASLREKEVMLKEIHHRVKNNLQVIASLVDMQTSALNDPAQGALFQDVRDRVRTMAMVHEKLYQSESLARLDLAGYTGSLASYLARAHGKPETRVELKLDLEPAWLSIEKAVPFGLILNELVTNAFKHAFRGRATGEVTTALRAGPDGQVCLRVADNGVGLPAGMDWRRAPSLGLQLIGMLAGQLRASVEVRTEGGTAFEMSFKPEPSGEKK